MELVGCGSIPDNALRFLLIMTTPPDLSDISLTIPAGTEEHSFYIPRILVAGTNSGCGKTTVSRGLMAALMKRGLKVQPFKVGPDFIDPSHHAAICGRPSRNLDLFMMGAEGILETFARGCEGADIAIIEGVMGLYDGIDGTTSASTAHIARILTAPVILVTNVKGMSNSVHALVQGFQTYDPDLLNAGVICNQVGSPRHRNLIEAQKTADYLGFIPSERSLRMESRHLGLVMGDECESNPADLITKYCDIDRILTIAQDVERIPDLRRGTEETEERTTIAIAHDRAFCFYYQDNLDLLRKTGAELVFFSPMQDHIPKADAIYLGGGYPELFASELESGVSCSEIKKLAGDGMPIYAECGGLMYLSRGMETENSFVRWADILPATCRMNGKFQALGYTNGTTIGGPSVASSGIPVRGHEFHYSGTECEHDARYAIRLSRGTGIHDGQDGLFIENCMGCYTHAYFSKKFAGNFIEAAHRYQMT